MLISLVQAKAHLRVDHDLDDDDITLKIEAASAAVLAYIGDTQYLFLDTGGEPIEFDTSDTSTQPEQAALRALHTCRQATMLLLGDWFSNREPKPSDVVHAGYGYLPRAVVALLYPLRDPTIA
jgi:hypothetical protein